MWDQLGTTQVSTREVSTTSYVSEWLPAVVRYREDNRHHPAGVAVAWWVFKDRSVRQSGEGRRGSLKPSSRHASTQTSG